MYMYIYSHMCIYIYIHIDDNDDSMCVDNINSNSYGSDDSSKRNSGNDKNHESSNSTMGHTTHGILYYTII